MKLIIITILLMTNIFSKEIDFKISYDSNYAPFSYKQDDKPAGLFIDVWNLWAKHNNYNIEFVDGLLWDDAVNLVKNKEVDFFLGSKKYEDWMYESNPFYEIKSLFFELSNNNTEFGKKRNLNIGIIGNDYESIISENYPHSKIHIYEDYIYSINALKSGEIDAIYDDKIAIEFYTVRNNSFHLIKPINKLLSKNRISAITHEEKLAQIFNDGLINIPITELLDLEKKWIINEKERYYLNFKQKLNLTEEELDFIKTNTIRASISHAWEPFSFKSEDNEALGISSEYWALISEKLNLKSSNIFYDSFSNQVESIKNKSTDLIASAGETAQRKEYAIFSKEYLNFPISIVTKKDENFIENILSIKHKRIAVGNNFTAHNILKNTYPEIKFILVKDVKEGLDLVSKGKVYAYIDIKPVLFYNITKYNFKDLKISGNTGLNFSLKFMIRDDYVILESILNKAISSISINELNTIVNKWDNIQFQTNFDYEFIWKIAIILILIFLAFSHRNRTLKNLNKTLTLKVEEKTRKLNEVNKNLEKLVEKKTKELIQKENILNHQSKMAAMGEMIENIAHQWRQPLSIISTVATGAKLKKELGLLKDEEFYETMDIINNSSQHLSQTIDDFRSFFNNDNKAINFNINIPIDKVLYLIGTKLKNRNITIVKKSEDINIKGIENEFIQVILNIINNSMDAFENKEFENKYIFISSYKKTNSVIIKIKDSAGGIKEDIISRVFEPYFTTKHQSQGTGIGLYMSIEIIKKHMNGKISVSNKKYIYHNTEYQGAEFKIELPLGIN
jgi:signal transduction histidine kinase